VISLGGSLIAPAGVDVAFLKGSPPSSKSAWRRIPD